MPPSTTVKLPPQLVRQLRTFRRRLRTVKMLEAVCLAGIAVILSYALLYLSDRLWETPPAVGWLLFFIAVSGLAVFIPWWSFRWVWQRRTESQLVKSKGITWPLFYTGVFYLAFVGLLTLLFSFIERKLSYFK